MSFNKRYINKDSLMQVRSEGLEYLISYLTKPDAVITEDEFSQKIYDIIINDRKNNLVSKLIEAGFYN